MSNSAGVGGAELSNSAGVGGAEHGVTGVNGEHGVTGCRASNDARELSSGVWGADVRELSSGVWGVACGGGTVCGGADESGLRGDVQPNARRLLILDGGVLAPAGEPAGEYNGDAAGEPVCTTGGVGVEGGLKGTHHGGLKGATGDGGLKGSHGDLLEMRAFIALPYFRKTRGIAET